jgi:hypothetical protein
MISVPVHETARGCPNQGRGADSQTARRGGVWTLATQRWRRNRVPAAAPPVAARPASPREKAAADPTTAMPNNPPELWSRGDGQGIAQGVRFSHDSTPVHPRACEERVADKLKDEFDRGSSPDSIILFGCRGGANGYASRWPLLGSHRMTRGGALRAPPPPRQTGPASRRSACVTSATHR